MGALTTPKTPKKQGLDILEKADRLGTVKSNKKMNTRKIRLSKNKHYKFGIVLPAGEYEAVHILNDVWQVKQNGIGLSVTEKQFDFVD